MSIDRTPDNGPQVSAKESPRSPVAIRIGYTASLIAAFAAGIAVDQRMSKPTDGANLSTSTTPDVRPEQKQEAPKKDFSKEISPWVDMWFSSCARPDAALLKRYFRRDFSPQQLEKLHTAIDANKAKIGARAIQIANDALNKNDAELRKPYDRGFLAKEGTWDALHTAVKEFVFEEMEKLPQ